MLHKRKIRKRLLRRQAELEQKLGAHQPAMDIESAADFAGGELSTYDNHPAESATQLYEREKDMALARRLREELSDVEHALAKFENGTYGLDEHTGERIPAARLDALPTARTAVGQSASSSVHRPVRQLSRASGHLCDDKYDELNAFDQLADYNDRPFVQEDGYADFEEEQTGSVEAVEALAATGITGYTGDDDVHTFRRRPGES
ncbi:MAG: hypothetical protein ABF868_03940 [Sporolactobacillus sp.]